MSGLECRNVMVEGRRTSVKLDGYTWRCLQDICLHRNMTVHDFCSEVNRSRADYSGFTNSLRIAILRHYRDVAITHDPRAKRTASYAASTSDALGRSLQIAPV